jgi:MFS family permease
MLASSKYHTTNSLPISHWNGWICSAGDRSGTPVLYPKIFILISLVGGGVVSDLFVPEQRGRGTAIYTLAPLSGPALGPVIGGFIAMNTSWRWVFYCTSIADGVVQILGLVAFLLSLSAV